MRKFDLRQEAKDHIILVAHRGVAGWKLPLQYHCSVSSGTFAKGRHD